MANFEWAELKWSSLSIVFYLDITIRAIHPFLQGFVGISVVLLTEQQLSLVSLDFSHLYGET